jgi:tRNA(adenine34) deaminase
MNEDEKWMKIAIQEAIKAENEGEVPVGAVLVKNGKLIAQAHNQPILKNDASAHAEIQLLRIAGQKTKNYRLNNAIIYVTLEPCIMCLGAIMNARIAKIVYGAHDLKIGACGSCVNLVNLKCFQHKLIVSGGVLENTCKSLLQDFFKNRR